MAALMEFLLAREAELSGAAAKATAEMEELEQAPGKMFNAKIRLHRALGEVRGERQRGPRSRIPVRVSAFRRPRRV